MKCGSLLNQSPAGAALESLKTNKEKMMMKILLMTRNRKDSDLRIIQYSPAYLYAD